MEKLIINYAFNKEVVANPDGSLSTNFVNVKVVNGPGNTVLGSFNKALDFTNNGRAQVNLEGVDPNSSQFCLQFIFKIGTSVTARQNLFESKLLPFAIFAVPGQKPDDYALTSTVRTKEYGWSGADTQFKKKLYVNRWYAVTVAFDFDTLAIFIDDQIISVHAFPNGFIQKGIEKKLFIGTWTDGRRDQLKGALALFRWYDGIPENFESKLDEQRTQAEWFISYKYESIRKRIATGKKTKPLHFETRTGVHMQYYEKCAILYHDSLGAAFEMHGGIYAKYKSMSNRSDLGYLVSDESNTTQSGGRKSVFSKGAIYWSRATGAIPVLEQIYIDYEHLGESRAIGFPTKMAKRINGGWEQEFQKARMYYREGASNAQEAHGSILQKFLSSGGINKWGYPVTNEMDIKSGNRSMGRFSEFENCTIFWKRGKGAFVVSGDIRRKYNELKGPLGLLGFPTSDGKKIPGVAGASLINSFEKGSILWYGSYNSIIVARPFRIWIGRVDSRESEGWGMGQNDLYFKYIRIKQGNKYLFNRRYPSSGDWSDRNIRDVNYTIPVTITPNSISQSVRFSVNIYDGDPGDDDFLGYYTKTLNAANAWGLRDNGGSFRTSFSKIRSFTWAVRPQVNLSTLSEAEKWWNVTNRGTNDLTWRQYASAFRDVDSDTEWWDVLDWLDKAFYELVVKDVAENGNCFGMALEGIYARKNASLFNMPINQYNNWEQVRKEFNIKHCYQVGAGPIWWFLSQFVTGNTHNPRTVFLQTREAFRKGNHPVICISENYDFSGSPHCILPVAWDSSRKPWRITIADPNNRDRLQTLTVDPDRNTYEYKNRYKGGEWSGGRLHYMPFSVLNKAPRTPIWDAILLILAGTIIILADDAETTGITDSQGNDLDAHGSRARDFMQTGRIPEEFFVNYQGFDRRSRSKPGQILLRRESLFSQTVDPITTTGGDLPVLEVLKDTRFAKVSKSLKGETKLKKKIAGRTALHLLNDPGILSELPDQLKQGLENLLRLNARRNYVHHVKGKKNGRLKYIVKHRLSEIKVETTLQANELHQINVNNLGTNSNLLSMSSARDKVVDITASNKLGVTGDFIQIKMTNIPIGANNQLILNHKSGMAGIEVLNMGKKTTTPVTVNGKVDGRSFNQTFNIPIERGVRLRPAGVLFNEVLTVNKIDRIFGPIISTQRLKAQ